MDDELDYLDWQPDDPDPCGHDDYEVDILDGRCRCSCGHSWYATEDQISRQIEFHREYAELEEREHRRQWWRDLYYKITIPLRPFRRWRARRLYGDDDLPF